MRLPTSVISSMLFTLISLVNLSCSKKEGCIDPNASNYVYEAGKNDGSCLYDMSFYTNTLQHGPIDIYIEGIFKGSLMNCAWISSSPICGLNDSNGGNTICVVNVPLKPGTYRVKLVAFDGTKWERAYELKENCLSIQVLKA